MQNLITYRPLGPDEHDFLQEMFYVALFVPPGQTPYPPEIIQKPELRKYYDAWGSNALDVAIVAADGPQVIGAIWGRTFSTANQGYGFIDENTPEISMAVKEEYRNRGVGFTLLSHVEATYRQKAVTAISLSVDKLNPATRLYRRFGFTIYKEAGTAFTMQKIL